MIREINVSEITAAIKEMCIQANHFLSRTWTRHLKLQQQMKNHL